MNTKYLFPIVAVTAAGLTMFGAVKAYADDTSTSSLAQKIAQKFNLNQADVQSVFEEYRTERQSKMKTRFEERLSQAVIDGKLTQAQQQAIISKHAELQTQHEANREKFQNLSPEERRAEMLKQRQSLEDWATQNGIDLQYFGFGGRHHGGR